MGHKNEDGQFLNYAQITDSRIFAGEDDGEGESFCNYRNVRVESSKREENGWCVTFLYDQGPKPEDYAEAFQAIEDEWRADGITAKVNPATAESYVMAFIPVNDKQDLTVTLCIMVRAEGIKQDGAATYDYSPDEPESFEFALLALAEMVRVITAEEDE